MRSTKHILWLCPGFAADEADDSCIPPLQLFLIELKNKYPDYKISIIAFQYPYKTEPYNWHNSTVFPINGRNRKSMDRLFTWRKVWNTYKKINKEDPVDIIQSFWFSECMLVGKFLSSRFHVPHINTLMGQDVLSNNRYLKKYFLKNVSIVALCERHAEIFKRNTKEQPRAVIPWGIDNLWVDLNNQKEYDIIAVGSLIPLKRYDLLIRVVNELKKEFPAIKVMLAGGGAEKESLEEQSRLLNLSDNLIVAGNQTRSSVMELMNKSRIFVHTSGFESFGFVFLEAMKYGLPVVSFPVGVAKASENWTIVNSENEMVIALTALLKNNIIISSSIPFSIQVTVENYAELYEKVLS